MSSIPTRMKKIRSKMKVLECSQHFPIITLWELFVAMETRVPILPGPKPNAINPHPNDASDKIWLNLPAGCRDIHGYVFMTNRL